MTASLRTVPLLAVLPMMVAALAVMSGCSGGSKDKKAASQVAVKVNGNELSIHQVNAQLARAGAVPPEQQDLVRKEIVDRLVDQQLLIQQATDKKLDRDPEVLAAIEQSKAQILAQAYVQKTLAAQARPSDDSVRAYYRENPALFEKRRVFRLQELATDLPLERADELKAVVASAKAMPEVITWLQKNKVQVAANAAVRGAEQLPLTQLEAISAMKDGEMAVFISDRKVTVLQVVASQMQPMDTARATPFIEQYLTSRRRDELARDEVKRLRDTAKIEYVGDFVRISQLSSAPAAASGAAASAPAAVLPADGSAPASGPDKGVAGLR